MVGCPIGDLAERGIDRDALCGLDKGVGIGGAGLGEDCGDRLHQRVAYYRAKTRIVVVFLLVVGEEGLVLGHVDLVPGIAGDDPAFGRVALQRIEIFRFTRQEGDDGAILEQAAGRALAHQLHQIGAKGHVEDGLRLCGLDGLRHRAGIDLALRRPLLGDEFDVRALLLQQLLEDGNGALAILIVRRDRRPLLGRQLGRFLGKHCGLHVVRRAQAEGIFIALRPGDGIRQRLARQIEHLLLLGERRYGKADIGEERAGNHHHAVLRYQFVGCGDRVAGLAAVILRDHDQLVAVDPAGCIDLVKRHLPTLLVGLCEGGKTRVTVDFADLDLGSEGLGSGGKPKHGTHRHSYNALHNCSLSGCDRFRPS